MLIGSVRAMNPEENRRSQRALALAGWSGVKAALGSIPDPLPVYYAHGEELDWLAALADPAPVEVARIAHLQADRDAGMIAQAGERFPAASVVALPSPDRGR